MSKQHTFAWAAQGSGSERQAKQQEDVSAIVD